MEPSSAQVTHTHETSPDWFLQHLLILHCISKVLYGRARPYAIWFPSSRFPSDPISCHSPSPSFCSGYTVMISQTHQGLCVCSPFFLWCSSPCNQRACFIYPSLHFKSSFVWPFISSLLIFVWVETLSSPYTLCSGQEKEAWFFCLSTKGSYSVFPFKVLLCSVAKLGITCG